MLTFKILESTLLEVGRHLTYRSLKISDLFGSIHSFNLSFVMEWLWSNTNTII